MSIDFLWCLVRTVSLVNAWGFQQGRLGNKLFSFCTLSKSRQRTGSGCGGTSIWCLSLALKHSSPLARLPLETSMSVFYIKKYCNEQYFFMQRTLMDVSSGNSHQTHSSPHLASTQSAQIPRKPVSLITLQSCSDVFSQPISEFNCSHGTQFFSCH